MVTSLASSLFSSARIDVDDCSVSVKMNKYLYQFTDISIKHRLDLFDKFIVPIICYGADVWGFMQIDLSIRLLSLNKSVTYFNCSTVGQASQSMTTLT